MTALRRIADFSCVFAELAIDITLIDRSGGAHDPATGIWQPGTPAESTIRVIVVPLTADDLRYDDTGTWSPQDRKVYTQQPLQLGQQIRDAGRTYTLQTERDYSDYAGLYIYWARRAGEVSQ